MTLAFARSCYVFHIYLQTDMRIPSPPLALSSLIFFLPLQPEKKESNIYTHMGKMSMAITQIKLLAAE